MSRLRAIFWCICFTTAFENFVRADDDLRSLEGSNQTLQFDLSRGIELRIANGEARIAVKMSALLNSKWHTVAYRDVAIIPKTLPSTCQCCSS